MKNFKSTAAKILLIALVAASIALPAISFASTQAWQQPSLWPTGFWGPIVWCTGNYLGTGNQCTNLCDLLETAINVLYLLMSIAIFIITPISVLVGSVMLMIAGANPEMMSRGKKVLTGTFVGLAIVLGSYLIVYTVVTTLGISGVGGINASVCASA